MAAYSSRSTDAFGGTNRTDDLKWWMDTAYQYTLGNGGAYLTCTLIVLSVIGLSVNIVIGRFILGFKKQTSMNLYLIGLTVCDALFCIAQLWLIVFDNLIDIFNSFSKVPTTILILVDILIEIQLTVQLVNACSTVAISVERYIAVCYPLKSKYILRKSRTLKVILFSWTVVVFLQVLEVLVLHTSFRTYASGFYNYYTSLSQMTYLIAAVIILVLYTLIAVSVWKSSHLSQNNSKLGITQENLKRRREAGYKTLGISVAIVIQYLVCRLPSKVLRYSEMVNIKHYQWMFLPMDLLSCSVDPLLYTLVSVTFRKRLRNYCASLVGLDTLSNCTQEVPEIKRGPFPSQVFNFTFKNCTVRSY